MKIITAIVSFAGLVCLCVYAHTPADIEIEPDFSANTTTVIVRHPVDAPRKYFVRSITVNIDGKEIASGNFTFQIGDYQRVVFNTPGIRTAEVITVRACHNGCVEKDFNTTDFTQQEQ